MLRRPSEARVSMFLTLFRTGYCRLSVSRRPGTFGRLLVGLHGNHQDWMSTRPMRELPHASLPGIVNSVTAAETTRTVSDAPNEIGHVTHGRAGSLIREAGAAAAGPCGASFSAATIFGSPIFSPFRRR
jgi:hypothetical protein